MIDVIASKPVSLRNPGWTRYRYRDHMWNLRVSSKYSWLEERKQKNLASQFPLFAFVRHFT